MKLLIPPGGNEKLGQGIWSWSLPAGPEETCPGATSLCARVCYATRYARRYPSVQESWDRRLKDAKRQDFPSRILEEMFPGIAIRVHVAGDFYSNSYINKWLEISERAPLGTLMFGYTRSWRVGALRPALEMLAKRSNFRLWASADAESGMPRNWPGPVAWMSVDDKDQPAEPVGMVFRNRRHAVIPRMNGSIVCPKENGIKNKVTCTRCRLCIDRPGGPWDV